MTDVDALRWYVAVAEELSFSRASKSLGVARQRVSAAVIALAEQEGGPLFVPGDGPTELTDLGRDMLVRARARIAAAEAVPEPVPGAPTLRIGFVPGVTVSKWTRIWADRYPAVTLEVSVVEQHEQRRALEVREVDMCFVRLPLDRDGLHVVPLWSEQPVVVVPKDHPVSLFDALTLADLDGEGMQGGDDPVPVQFEMVAAGVGPVIVPQSLARLYSRKDLVARAVSDSPPTRIALAWPSEGASEFADDFLAVVRGRTANSSRGPAQASATPTKPRAQRPSERRHPQPTGRRKRK